MSEQLVALTRQDRRLSAIVSRAVVLDEKPTEYGLAQVAVEAVKAADVCERNAIEAWRGLADVRLHEPRSVASAIGVLLATVPMGEPASGASPADGRAWLCQPLAWADLRPALRAQSVPVLRALRGDGWGAAVERLPSARDPYVAYHHGAADAPPLQALPPRFRAFVLPLLRGRRWADVRRALSLYRGLGLSTDDARLAVVVRVLASGRRFGLSWLSRIDAAPPARQPALASLVLRSGVVDRDPALLPPGAFERLAALPNKVYADRVGYLLDGLRRGVGAGDVLEEMQIATEFAYEYRFRSSQPTARHRALPAGHGRILRRILAHVRRASADGCGFAGFAVHLWRWSVATPARAGLLARPALTAWPGTTTRAVLESLMDAPISRWTEAERVDALEALLVRVPASHHVRAVEEAAILFEEEGMDSRRLTAGLDLVVRLARPPFRTAADCWATAWVIWRGAGRRPERLAELKDRTVHRLERALGPDEGSAPARAGIQMMGAAASGFLVDALVGNPEPGIAVAGLVGLLSPPRARALLKRFRAQSAMQRSLARAPLERLCATIEHWVRLGVPSPIPRRLRRHRDGSVVLSSGSLERHRQAIVRRLLPFRLGVLRRMVLVEIAASVAVEPAGDADRHALEMLGSVTSNRRLLRRVLRVAPDDRVRYLEDHPANRAWLARHPRLDALLWRQGLREEVCADGTRVRLQFEADPLEVLRMGTRVGSCLSVGGVNSGSAVAVMADANKRVVIACDAQGAFLARQLVAITEDDRLACAAVYPRGVPAAVADAFLAYDHRLAQALGLPLVGGNECDYTVASVVARFYYDDGGWGRIVPGDVRFAATGPSSRARPGPSRRSS
jgi:hypothetical protein